MCYTPGEIITEKMRSLMQRTMPWDLYDTWYLFERENYNIEDFILNFRKKMEFKKLNTGDFVKEIQNTIVLF